MEDRYMAARKNIAASLEAARKKKGVSLYAIQRHTGLAFHQVKGILSGVAGCNSEAFIAILDAFGVDLTELVKEKLTPKPDKRLNTIKK